MIQRQIEGFDFRPSRLMFPILGAVVALVLFGMFMYSMCRIEVPSRHMALIIRKTGLDLENDQELAPTADHKGLQENVLGEGRYFRNPYSYDWEVVPQIEIPQGKLGVRIRLSGDELPYGQMVADEGQKGIVREVLNPGRYAINAMLTEDGQVVSPTRYYDSYAERIELHDPIVIPAGFKGVVTNLSGKMPEDPNQMVVSDNSRGVQVTTRDEGTYYVNPYVERINLVDCRSQRFNLSTGDEMGFPSKDGFWVTLDGVIEFRVLPEMAAQVFVTYNDSENDEGSDARVDEEIINKVILPNARSFCRLRGSDHSGKDFISGDTRSKFQEDFQAELERRCESQGIEIIQALITRIHPPQKIAQPVRDRQIAAQEEQQFSRQIQQQESEKQLAIEQSLIKRKQAMVQANREVIKVTTDAKRRQEVAVILANQQLKVAELELQAAEDRAAAALAKGRADAEVISFKNEAEAAGWRRAVEAFGGQGEGYARWVMLKKMAPSYQRMMVNTADSPIMDIFRQYDAQDKISSPADAVMTASAKSNSLTVDATREKTSDKSPSAEDTPEPVAAEQDEIK